MDKQLLDMILSLPADEIAKAVKDAKGLEGIRIIKDLWEDYHASPERNDTKTGPAMHSSGQGVDKAIDNYSNPAKQVGITEQYDKFTESNVEGWGKAFLAAMKAENVELVSKMEAGLGAILSLLKKGEEEKEEEKKEEKKEEEHKSADSEHEPDCKSASEKIASLWDALADLEEAYAKAEEHDEKKDIKGLEEARDHIEKAEKELEAVEAHEKEEDASHKAMKAQVSINLGWRSLVKATGLSSYDLHGYGNQADEQVPGDSTSDNSKHDLKGVKAKANYYASKLARMEKSLGIAPLKKDTVEMDQKGENEEEKKESNLKKDADPAPNPDPQTKSDMDDMKTELQKATESMKAMSDRVAFLNKRVEEVSGRKMTPMTLISVKSAGISSDSIAKNLNDRIEIALDNGDLASDEADIARSLVQRYMAAGKGYIGLDKVNMQLDQAPSGVKSFFDKVETGILQ